MLLQNIDPFNGHFNGAQYIVKEVYTNLLTLESATNENTGMILTLPKKPCGPDCSNFPIQGFSRTQFPVRVCLVITISKAQGQPFSEGVELDLSDTVFSHGNLYVGLSREIHPDKLSVCLAPDLDSQTKDVVCTEALAKTPY